MTFGTKNSADGHDKTAKGRRTFIRRVTGKAWPIREERASIEDEAQSFIDDEVFYSLREAQLITESWRKHYNTKRPHYALGCRPPAPEAIVPVGQRPIMH